MNRIQLKQFALVSLAAGLMPVMAQTTPSTPPATCTAPPTSITALNLERVVALTNIGSTTTPNINPTILAGVTGGSLELRQNFVYNPSTNVIAITEFAAQPGSNSPTQPGNILSSNLISQENFTVDKIYYSCKPYPSVLIAGTITQNFPVSPVGNLIGVPAAISMGYTTDNPAKVTNVAVVYAGIATVYSAAATGTLTFPAPSTTPPGTTGAGPVIVITGGNTQTTAQKQIGIDASTSTSTASGGITTYAAIQVAPPSSGTGSTGTGSTTGIPQAASITPSGVKGVFLVTFAGGKGTYAFQISATDSTGTSNQIVVIDYRGL